MDIPNRIGLFDDGWLYVSTIRCLDTCRQPYETGIRCPEYNDGRIVIVQSYDTEEESRTGHQQWIDLMQENPPDYLRDCGNHIFGQILELLNEDSMLFYRENHE